MATRYERIADDLRSLIASGTLALGEQLPSEPELASRYQVSKPTLRNALDVLQREGLVEKLHGRGNFVRRLLPQVTYDSDRRAAEARTTAAALQIRVSSSKLKAPDELSALLRVPPGAWLTEYIYLTHQEECPYSLARVYVPYDVADPGMPTTTPSPWGDDIRERLIIAGIQLASTVHRVTPRPSTPEEAEALRITARAAVLAIERVTTDVTGRVVEAALLALPCDRTEAIFTTYATIDELQVAQ